jgi:hypothetical protein
VLRPDALEFNGHWCKNDVEISKNYLESLLINIAYGTTGEGVVTRLLEDVALSFVFYGSIQCDLRFPEQGVVFGGDSECCEA